MAVLPKRRCFMPFAIPALWKILIGPRPYRSILAARRLTGSRLARSSPSMLSVLELRGLDAVDCNRWNFFADQPFNSTHQLLVFDLLQVFLQPAKTHMRKIFAPFKVRNGDTTGIQENVRDDHDTAPMQVLFGAGRRRAISGLGEDAIAPPDPDPHELVVRATHVEAPSRDWLDETPHCFRATMFSLAKR